jgi:hypothetical protein
MRSGRGDRQFAIEPMAQLGKGTSTYALHAIWRVGYASANRQAFIPAAGKDRVARIRQDFYFIPAESMTCLAAGKLSSKRFGPKAPGPEPTAYSPRRGIGL